MSQRTSQGRLACAACAAFLISLATTVNAAPLLGLDYGNGNLYEISTTDASLSIIGNSGVKLSSFVFRPDGKLYGFTVGSQPQLYRLDPQTAAATLVAPMISPGIFLFEGGMAVSPAGVTYGLNYGGRTNDSLFTFDLSTGLVTKIATLNNGAHDINGMVWRSDGMLVAIDEAQEAVVLIDPTNGVTTILTDLTSSTLNPKPTLGANGDMTAIGDMAYFATAGPGANPAGSNELWKIDLYTGVPERIGAFSAGLSTQGIGALAAPVPEPATLGLLALAGLMLRRRR